MSLETGLCLAKGLGEGPCTLVVLWEALCSGACHVPPPRTPACGEAASLPASAPVSSPEQRGLLACSWPPEND